MPQLSRLTQAAAPGGDRSANPHPESRSKKDDQPTGEQSTASSATDMTKDNNTSHEHHSKISDSDEGGMEHKGKTVTHYSMADIDAVLDEFTQAANTYLCRYSGIFAPPLWYVAIKKHKELSDAIDLVRDFAKPEAVNRWTAKQSEYRQYMQESHDDIRTSRSSCRRRPKLNKEESNTPTPAAQNKEDLPAVRDARKAIFNFRRDCLKIIRKYEHEHVTFAFQGTFALQEGTLADVDALQKVALGVVKKAKEVDEKTGTELKKELRGMCWDGRRRFADGIDETSWEYSDPDLDPYHHSQEQEDEQDEEDEEYEENELGD
ncbi:hypothetical protein BJ170DRAFT_720433 [Xylariales sp. AK1849]|nr:hypothetical protein BJ170DRAFT_720433 [Xylariales sp. AK1849]